MPRTRSAQQPLPSRAPTSRQSTTTTLILIAFVFAVAAVWVWFTDESGDAPTAPPPARTTDEVQLAHVLEVLQQTDPRWAYGRTTARTEQLPMPGQLLTLGDARLYVFIFLGSSGPERIAAREQASAELDLDSLTLTSPSGEAVNAPGQPLHVAEHGSVITILTGGDEVLNAQIAEALTKLP